MTFQIKRATKSASKLRLAVFGPSGAGKTYTSLRIATGLGGRIGLIDTERGSASKYSDRFAFDVIELEAMKDIDTVAAAIHAFANAGHDVLIIDSLSHAWQELLTEIDKLAQTKFKGNTWSAWSQGTPKQRGLVDSILSYPGHVIGTMRSKTEWTQETGRDGKSKPVRVGLAPEQGKGIEYEFDMLMELSVSHVAEVIKDRTGKFQDALIEKPGEDLGRQLAAWLADGVPALSRPPLAPPMPEVAPEPAVPSGEPLASATQLDAIARELKKEGVGRDDALAFFRWFVRPDLGGSRELTAREATGFLALVARGQFADQLALFAAEAAGGPPDVAPFEPNGTKGAPQ